MGAGGGGWGCLLWIFSDWMIEGFFWCEIFNSRILGGLENLASIFLEWLDLRRDFIGYSKQIRGSANVSHCVVL